MMNIARVCGVGTIRMASPSERPPMRMVPLERPSRLRLVLLGILWLTLGSAAVVYLALRAGHLTATVAVATE